MLLLRDSSSDSKPSLRVINIINSNRFIKKYKYIDESEFGIEPAMWT